MQVLPAHSTVAFSSTRVSARSTTSWLASSARLTGFNGMQGQFLTHLPARSFLEVNMLHKRPQPPQPDRIRIIHGSFGWIDHRFLRQGFDQGLSRLEKLFYFVLIAVSNCDGVSFYSDERLAEILDIRHAHELTGARNELVARDLIAFKERVYQVLDLPSEPRRYGHE
jgi:hypothetical protein